MKSRKRILAGILSVVLVFSLAQFPGGVSYAGELPPVQEVFDGEDSTASEDASQQEPGSDQEPGQETSEKEKEEEPGSEPPEEDFGDNGKQEEGEPAQPEKPSEEEQPSGQEPEEPKEELPADEENQDEADDEIGEPDEELPQEEVTVSENNLQVSGNDIMSVEEPEGPLRAEIKGAYQFGDAPSAAKQAGDASTYSISAYSEAEVEEYLYQQMKERNEQIDISQYKIPLEKVKDVVFGGVLNEHPELYFVGKYFSYNIIEGGYVGYISPVYIEGYDDAKWQQGVDAALASVDQGMSDLEKAIALHDYLTVNCEYDTDSANNNNPILSYVSPSHSTYGVFANRAAVCDGYALSYKYLLSQVGIDCFMVTSDTINHAWNLIKLDGQYYQVDVTWDDPVQDLTGRSLHTYMFRSDAAFDPETDPQKHLDGRVTYGSQTVDYKATDTRYDNAFWTDCTSPLVISDDGYYYVAFDKAGRKPRIKKTDRRNIEAAGTAVTDIASWTVWGNSNAAWQGAFSGLFCVENRLYFNDKKYIYSIAMDGTDKKKEFTADTTDGYIYGCAYYKGTVRYSLRQSPLSQEKETILVADIEFQGTEKEMLGDETSVIFKTDRFVYSGTEQEPQITVLLTGVTLKEGKDYVLSYQNNRNAGTATVNVEGAGRYVGSISRTFEIQPAPILIRARDKTILIGEEIPANSAYAYDIDGLVGTDDLLKNPSFSCAVTDTKAAGRYDIVPSGADAGANYTIGYENGRLTVASEYVSCMVTFDVQGHGTVPAAQIDVKVGGTAQKPEEPTADGYRFGGWYRDAACTKAWDFDVDIVQTDMTLYAKWLEVGKESGDFAFQEIADVYYTGKVCKPVVSVYDGDVLLKSGRDYQIKYYNNISANKDGVLKTGNGEGADYNPALPYVEIIGKGDYTDKIKDGNKDTVKVNFNILQASIGNGTEQPAAGVTLKVSEQLATAKRVQKPFSSVKYVKGMKRDVDFRLRLTAESARDKAGRSLRKGAELINAEIPVGYEGKFLLTVEGIGNYTGSVCRTVYVADKAHLMKNATVTLGKNLKTITFTGEAVKLSAARENGPDVFTVKYGKTFLIPQRDYTVSYRYNDRAGKAELVITGNGEYIGTKICYFNIKGRTFSAGTVQVSGLENKTYTGRALTQNTVSLTYGVKNEAPKKLQYGTDYTVTYAKNINKGTATITFKGAEKAGYSGSFKKTFKIAAADIGQVKRAETMGNMEFPYCKAGVKPVEEIVLTNRDGFVLQRGRDYTLSYKNNRAVADAGDDKPPMITVKGKGNYTGKFDVTFRITKSDLKQAVEEGGIQIKAAAVVYNPKKAEDYVYKPAVKLMDGKIALRANTDYECNYEKNTQADYQAYLQAYDQAVKSGKTDPDEGLQALRPKVVITVKAGSNYKADGEIVEWLPIYRTKLVKKDLRITVSEAVYTGSRVTPAVTVRSASGEKMFMQGKDYTVSYGANNKSGKNRGSVTITGVAPEYGGSITVKFDIMKKVIVY